MIFHFQTDTMFEDMVANPAEYGFTNVTQQAVVTGGDPDTYLFWDSVHPTSRAHGFLADAAFALATPEPATLGLLALGAMALVRRRAA